MYGSAIDDYTFLLICYSALPPNGCFALIVITCGIITTIYYEQCIF